MNKIYLNEYILSFQKILNTLDLLCINNSNITKCEIGKTAFGYSIPCVKIGRGKKHIAIIGATHGLELVTTYFVIELIFTLLNNYDLQRKYTFHLIPVLNPEGYIISSSNVINNIKKLSKYEFEKLSFRYMNVYNKCDNLASKGYKIKNGFYCVLNSSLEVIDNIYLKQSVKNILKKCNLSENVLPVWTANGLGVDQNSNSIHEFENIKKLRNMQKCAYLRYNIIPVTIPSPMSYPGEYTFDRSIENLSLYNYINKLYNNYNLEFIFSFHSTGGEIYGFPDVCDSNIINRYKKYMDIYSMYTGYKIIDEKIKYGVMDYYRKKLDSCICLTIELSKLNANPIGPFSNLELLKQDIINNKKAVIKTIE